MSELTEKMLRRYHRLQNLKREVDTELAALERGLRIAGVIKRRGKNLKTPTHTEAQAREAHRRWQNGEREDPWVAAGERQYKREQKRAERGAA